ncbi:MULTISPECIES: hemolysin family protein [unclassified Isoptericola]|uniref:hemolysin family protein n=1 Tax=unclassified Isoptericola TaxID=2623355 RepID=UPI002712EE08|nr:MULTISPECIES: hemolysin family protein [unclassified Isoptericola]MDO8144863.1 hemolysin family protein [Isoptericola sp. 178]MDO8149643.1 hemolysin family protein [Isoptericola sp. b515]MDO8152577.1 hemolysin family protein [Isoptericola sp. b408]
MTNPWIVLAVTTALLVASGFFVIIEFALIGARRHRLEEMAPSSGAARSALRATNELTVMLAGAQLGITACTFALGAVTKPALDAWLGPGLEAVGAPYWLADTAAFLLSLLVVTFLHLVLGEMAPKSWAITHPERSAMLIAPPARAFIWVFRPLLGWINRMANRLVAATGVEPVDRAAVGGQDADTIRHLVDHSTKEGALDDALSGPLAGALDLSTREVSSFVSAEAAPTAVPADADVAAVQEAARRSGHLRILVDTGDGPPGIVHVRDTLLEPSDRLARDLARPAYVVRPRMPVHEALSGMRRESVQLAVVMDGDLLVGVVSLEDALDQVIPRS